MPRLSRRVASAAYAALTLLAVGLSALPPVELILCLVLAAAVLAGVVGLLVVPALRGHCGRQGGRAPNAADEKDALIAGPPEVPTDTSMSESAQAKGARLLYLDNVKAALTAVVVLHHVVGAFSGSGSLGLSVGDFYSAFQVVALPVQILDQSWFMCCFFFVSAYFTPSSLARKGAHPFLADKFKRLGIPFLAYTFVLGPLLTLLVDQAVIGHGGRPLGYNITPAQTWFLAWLLTFNVAYVLVAGDGMGEDHLVCPLPSVGVLCLVCGAVGPSARRGLFSRLGTLGACQLSTFSAISSETPAGRRCAHRAVPEIRYSTIHADAQPARLTRVTR